MHFNINAINAHKQYAHHMLVFIVLTTFSPFTRIFLHVCMCTSRII